jgi:hypothetical protein
VHLRSLCCRHPLAEDRGKAARIEQLAARVAQLFVTQLRQVETALQVREQRAVARMSLKARTRPRGRKAAAKAARARTGASPRRRGPAKAR